MTNKKNATGRFSNKFFGKFRIVISVAAFGILGCRLATADDPAPPSDIAVKNGTAAEALLQATPRLRGFTVPHTADDAIFNTLHTDWGVNVIRLLLRPMFDNMGDPVGQWKKELAGLPAQMEAARRNHIFVVVSLFDPPIATYKDLRTKRNAWQHYLWRDPGMLEEMKQQAVETAKVLEPYKDSAWLELVNEPLDWDDMPSYPKKWPAWAQEIVNAVREVSAIPIVVEPGPGSLCSGYKTFPLLSGGGIVYSVHSYEPEEYTAQGIKSLTATDLAHTFDKISRPWPGTFSGVHWDKERLRESLAPAIEFAEKNHVRMYVGEFGVARWAPNADGYLRDNIDLFEELGWDWTNHAFRESTIWSAEYNETYEPKPQLATSPTKRALVLKEAFSHNQ
jgi:hypothetical protein